MNDRAGLRVNVDTGVGVVLASLLFIGVALIPSIGAGIIVFLPLPILYFYTKLGRWRGAAIFLTAFIVTAGALSVASRPLSGLTLFAVAGLIGMLLAELIRRGCGFVRTLVIGVVALALLATAFLLYDSLRTGLSPWRIVETHLTNSLQENLRLYAELDLPPEQVAFIRDNAPRLLRFFMTIFPSIALVSIAVCIWANLLAGRFLLRIGGIGMGDDVDLSRWKTPERLIWVLIAAGGFLILPGEAAEIIGLNVLIVCAFLYLLQGLSIAGFFFRAKNVPPLVRFLFYALLVLQQYLLLIVAAFGMFDLWVDFRRFIKRKEDRPAA